MCKKVQVIRMSFSRHFACMYAYSTQSKTIRTVCGNPNLFFTWKWLRWDETFKRWTMTFSCCSFAKLVILHTVDTNVNSFKAPGRAHGGAYDKLLSPWRAISYASFTPYAINTSLLGEDIRTSGDRSARDCNSCVRVCVCVCAHILYLFI